MAIRKIRTMGDRILTKKCRPVEEMTPKIKTLINDMLDTMYDAYGVGLAAPQVGILKRIVVIDVGDRPWVLINPEITETSGEQTGDEGCLSLPGKSGTVTRPNVVTVKAMMKIWNRLPSPERDFWQEQSVMSVTIWTVLCTWNMWKVNCGTLCMMMKKRMRNR